tara:strand:+ start:79 stop:534 length:456 start_codon:yes stop_codon:yes gene_type:complete
VVLILFLIDRVSKIYILKLAEANDVIDIYVTPFLNIYLTWNQGVAFGLLSFSENYIYNLVTIIIIIVIIVVITMIIKEHNLKKYLLLFVLGGALGNIFDRIYYSAVPDFIDIHVKGYHWFIFNFADIFITIGVIGLIFEEVLNGNKNNEKI